MRGEAEYIVHPLALPVEHDPGVDALETSAAGALFLERARTVVPDLTLTRDEVGAIAGICRRLAGIPLALELAAARIRLLDASSLLARLDDVLAADGARDLPARQRTMGAALDWSYGLLDERAKALLRTASVFAGGFSLEDLEAVADRAATVRGSDVFTALAELVEQSLVIPVPTSGLRRHRILEPVAQYAHAILERVGEAPAVEGAHIQHFLDLAEQAAPEYQRVQQVDWLVRVDAEHANMSAAMDQALASGAYESAARMGRALWLCWWLRGDLLHGRRYMERVLEHDLPDSLRTKVEVAAATMAFGLDDFDASRRWWQSAFDRSRGSDDVLSQANSLAGVGLVALASGDLEAAGNQLRAASPLAESVGDEGEWLVALIHIWLGTVALLGDDPDGAAASIERGLASARRRGDRLAIYIALYNLSQVAASRGDLAQARQHLEEGMRVSVEAQDVANLAYLLEALSVVESSCGRRERVPVLLGAAKGIRETIGTTGYGYYRPDPEHETRAIADAQDRLGNEQFNDGFHTGRAMSIDEAVAFAFNSPANTG